MSGRGTIVGRTAAELAGQVAGGELHPRDVVAAHLERVERVNPLLNAFRVVRADAALAEADGVAARDDHGGDRRLLELAAQIEQLRPWSRHAPLPASIRFAQRGA